MGQTGGTASIEGLKVFGFLGVGQRELEDIGEHSKLYSWVST